MITNVIQFPAERCRPPMSAVEATELLTFDRAAKRYAAERGNEDIISMMRLSLEGVCAGPRTKAAQWLHQHLNVLIRQAGGTRDDEQGVQ